MRLLIIDDEPAIRLAISQFLKGKGWEIQLAATGAEARRMIEQTPPDAAVVDMKLPDTDGMSLLAELKLGAPGCAVFILTAWGTISDAVQAMRLGAEQYLTKPADLDQIEILLGRVAENLALRSEAAFLRERAGHPLVGRSAKVVGLRELITLAADNPAVTVLIQGESGTGKELVAREIHRLSVRAAKPFVDINCAGLSPTLLESELFGHERGAFTDAKQSKRGLFEVASGGTLFLDEITEMDISIQAKLLRVLQNQTFRRVGGTRDISTDARVVAASNRDIAQQVKAGAFRDDLYYRLNVFPIEVPTLRERTDDIALLAEFFAHSRGGRPHIAPDALRTLQAYPWPGNVRELRNIVERALIFSRGGDIRLEHLPLELQAPRREFPENENGANLSLAEAEHRHIARVLKAHGGNMSETARVLGISRSTLQIKVRKYGLEH